MILIECPGNIFLKVCNFAGVIFFTFQVCR